MVVDKALLNKVIGVARSAAEEILTIYHQSSALDVVSKADDSPLTQADISAHHIILNGLKRISPEIPVISEESLLPDFAQRQQWGNYWLVDPLDGTKEFISRNGEFTVNIALIDKGVSVLGVVYVPVSNICYAGFSKEPESELLQKPSSANKCTHKYACKITANHTVNIKARSAQKRVNAALPIEVLASRHHRADAVDIFCAKIDTHWGQTRLCAMGSSLKLCLIAEGKADLYPRFGPTSEWDTAAAQAIVEAAGGYVLNASGLPLRYNQKENIRNPDFFVIGEDIKQWRWLLTV